MPLTTFQHSLDSDVDLGLPSWTTLSTGGTSEEDDSQLPDSRDTTPDPVDKLKDNYEQATGQADHSPSGVRPYYLNNHAIKEHKAGTNQTTNPRKRTISHLEQWSNKTAAPQAPRFVKRKAQSSNAPSGNPAGGPLDRSGITTPTSSTAPTGSTSALPRPQRKAKLLRPITEDSDRTEWERVDRLLQTHVAPAVVLPQYAPSARLHEPKNGAHGMMHVALQLRQGVKGKARAKPMWTEPSWSNVGEFKERLDRMFGRGDITGGQGRAPKNAKRLSVIESGGVRLVDEEEPRPYTLEEAETADEDTDRAPRSTRRARLERTDIRKVDPRIRMS
ncbi:hypothetical protein C8Q73DRAFT_694530 [Cubamyces lactineus]|nr:hypothetical protein C8Q73DRAFT_694530 [Cubamyces lactineus]